MAQPELHLSREEIHKLETILEKSFFREMEKGLCKKGDFERLIDSWKQTCESLGIERTSRIMSLILQDKEDEVKIQDPTGMVVSIPLELAKKILVLGI